jgi:YfiH family protein
MSHPGTVQGWVPDWPVAPRVKAFFSTRPGGVSQAPWDSLNLGDHVGDSGDHVLANRGLWRRALGVPPVFLQQVHGVDVLDIGAQTPPGRTADACWTDQPGVACTILVADCLPVLFTNPTGAWVAAAHAGWRGLAGSGGQGVLETTLARCLRSDTTPGIRTSDIHVWLGPCMGPQAFEVGPEVRAAFCAADPAAAQAFMVHCENRYMADLALLARLRLQRAGVSAIFGNDSTPAWCTHTQASLFFSHRRDAARLGSTGRMAASIWLDRG